MCYKHSILKAKIRKRRKTKSDRINSSSFPSLDILRIFLSFFFNWKSKRFVTLVGHFLKQCNCILWKNSFSKKNIDKKYIVNCIHEWKWNDTIFILLYKLSHSRAHNYSIKAVDAVINVVVDGAVVATAAVIIVVVFDADAVVVVVKTVQVSNVICSE